MPVNWFIGIAQAKQPEPDPKAKKPRIEYAPIPEKTRPHPKLYGLTQDVEISTPQGVVDAFAGDLLLVTDSELWVVPPEKVPLGWGLKIQE